MFSFIYWTLLSIAAVVSGVLFVVLGEDTRNKIYGGLAIVLGLMFLGQARAAWLARKNKQQNQPKI